MQVKCHKLCEHKLIYINIFIQHLMYKIPHLGSRVMSSCSYPKELALLQEAMIVAHTYCWIVCCVKVAMLKHNLLLSLILLGHFNYIIYCTNLIAMFHMNV